MVKRLIILLLAGQVASAQSTDPPTLRLNNEPYTWFAGTTYSDSVLTYGDGAFRILKPFRLAYLATTAQDALSVPAGYMIFNSDTNTVAFYDGSNWQPLATRAYARSVGGGGGGTTYTFQHSITESGGTVNLVNDQSSPGNSKLYGTDGSGTKGWYDQPSAGVTDHGALTGLSDDDHTQYALLAGRSSGQTLTGGTGSAESLTLVSTSHGTKGSVLVTGHLTASTSATYDMGTTAVRWRYGFLNGLNINSSVAGAAGTINVSSGFTITNGSTPSASGATVMTMSSAPSTATLGETNLLNMGVFGFSPTSGTGTFNMLKIAHTINQTGGASGVTRSIYVAPTITAAADYRAFENTVGNVILNSTSGSVGVGTTSPDAKIDIETTSTQLRLGYNSSVQTTATTDANGVVTITPSGRYVATPTGATGNIGYLPNVIYSANDVVATSGTSETDLYSVTTRATELGADGESLEFMVHGTVNSEAGDKTIRAYWAGTEVFEATSSSLTVYPYELRVTVTRTSSTNARVYAHVVGGGFAFSGVPDTNPRITNVTTTFSNTNILKVTGQATDGASVVNVQDAILWWRPSVSFN